ncbi:MAG: TolC family protein [Muribaculaceae bacterium]
MQKKKYCHYRAMCLTVVSVFMLTSSAGKLDDELHRIFGIAERNNSMIRAEAIAMQRARNDVGAARSERLPDINTSLTLSYIGNGQLWNRNFGEYMKAEMPHFGNTFSLSVHQPVYMGGAISSGIRAAELSVDMANISAEQTRSNVRLQLTALLLQLHCLENSAVVLRRNIALADSLIARATARRNEGVALKNDVTRYELMRSTMEVKLTAVSNGISIVKQEMCTAAGVADTTSMPLSRLDVADFDIADAAGEEFWQQLACNNNTSIRQAMVMQQLSVQNEKIVRSASLPKVSLFAENNLNGPILIEVPPINKNFNLWMAGVAVSYDISSLYKNKRKVRSAAIATRHVEQQGVTTRERVSDSVHEAYMNLLTAQSDLQTHCVSCRLAQENYEVIANRYGEGLALVTDMTDASNMRLEAELQLVNSQIAVASAYYRLKYIAGELGER